jgi:shikimate kinase
MLIYLIGFMGSGKTTTGKKLAQKLKYNFTDTDSLFEEQQKQTIADFFLIHGEDKFREIEKKILASTTRLKNTVVASGGGTPCFEDNLKLMNESGITIYLQANAGALFKRLAPEKKNRPLISKLSDVALMEFIVYNLKLREHFYLQSKLKVNAKYFDDENFNDFVKVIKKEIADF